MADDEIVPKVEEITFSGRLVGTLDQIKSKLATTPFFALKITDNTLSIARIESRNIHKKPFLFYFMTIQSGELSIVYSIAPDTSEKLRRLYVIKNIASILSMISDYYEVDNVKFYQYVDSSIDDTLNGISQSYSTLFNKYDSLLTEYRETRRLNLELAAANRNLTIQTSQLDEENKQLENRLKALETYSDDSLMAMIEDWIETHNSSIDVSTMPMGSRWTSP